MTFPPLSLSLSLSLSFSLSHSPYSALSFSGSSSSWDGQWRKNRQCHTDNHEVRSLLSFSFSVSVSVSPITYLTTYPHVMLNSYFLLWPSITLSLLSSLPSFIFVSLFLAFLLSSSLYFSIDQIFYFIIKIYPIRYRTNGDGGQALKLLLTFVKNILDNPSDPK